MTFGVSLGLCGLTYLGALSGGGGGLLIGLGVLESLAMVLSAAGLVLTALLWVAHAVLGSFQSKVSQPQKLFDEKNDTKLDKEE